MPEAISAEILNALDLKAVSDDFYSEPVYPPSPPDWSCSHIDDYRRHRRHLRAMKLLEKTNALPFRVYVFGTSPEVMMNLDLESYYGFRWVPGIGDAMTKILLASWTTAGNTVQWKAPRAKMFA